MRSGLQGGILLFIMAVALCHCTLPGPQRRGRSTLPPPSAREQWHQRVASRKARPPLADLTITYPYDGAVFPPEIAAPTFRWIDHHPDSTHWLAVLRFSDKANPVYAMTDRPQWQPDPAIWAAIKARSVDAPAEVVIFGVRSAPAKMLTAEGRIAISTSRDLVDASILYRQVPLPFETGTRGLRQMLWRLGDITSDGKPTVVMQDMTTCASCHQVSQDGHLISMELNFRGDSGARLIAPVKSTIAQSADHFMTWSDFPKPDLLPRTRGVFAKLSPQGNYLVGTVNEISILALTNDPAFCQLFFPTYGILAWQDMNQQQFKRLPGADDPEFVQTDPSWSWDEKYVVLARARTRNEYHDPGAAPFYYRFRKIEASIAAKDHTVYRMTRQKMARYRELFLREDYTVSQLPSYAPATTANPLKTFAVLPARARYQFMLDDARFFVEGFMKGPVCRGEVALNVINDHFFIAFFDPGPRQGQQRCTLSQRGQRIVEHPLGKKKHAAAVEDLAPLCLPPEKKI